MMESDISALWVTLQLALISTSILMIAGTPAAWWLAHTQRRIKPLIEAIISLPLVLPPTVLGFYLLISLGPNGPGGALAHLWGETSLAFTFTGLVIGSVIYSLPFVVQPLQNAFAASGRVPLEVAATLRAAPLDRFFSVALPMAKSGYITAATLGFAHTLGEFGVVLMIGGNIPGKTQVLSIAIYNHVEALDYGHAHILAAGLLVTSLILLTVVYSNRKRRGIMP